MEVNERNLTTWTMYGIFCGIADQAEIEPDSSDFLEDTADYPVSQWLRDNEYGDIAELLSSDENYRDAFWDRFERLFPGFREA